MGGSRSSKCLGRAPRLSSASLRGTYWKDKAHQAMAEVTLVPVNESNGGASRLTMPCRWTWKPSIALVTHKSSAEEVPSADGRHSGFRPALRLLITPGSALVHNLRPAVFDRLPPLKVNG